MFYERYNKVKGNVSVKELIVDLNFIECQLTPLLIVLLLTVMITDFVDVYVIRFTVLPLTFVHVWWLER